MTPDADVNFLFFWNRRNDGLGMAVSADINCFARLGLLDQITKLRLGLVNRNNFVHTVILTKTQNLVNTRPTNYIFTKETGDGLGDFPGRELSARLSEIEVVQEIVGLIQKTVLAGARRSDEQTIDKYAMDPQIMVAERITLAYKDLTK